MARDYAVGPHTICECAHVTTQSRRSQQHQYHCSVLKPPVLPPSCFNRRKSCKYPTITGGQRRTTCSHSRSSYFLQPAVMFSQANCQAASACSYLPARQYRAASAARVSLLPGARLDTFSN
jgi:hypothetical protein